MGSKLRLVDRIRALPSMNEGYIFEWMDILGRESVLGRCRTERSSVYGGPALIVDEIAEMYYANPKEEWWVSSHEDNPSDFPNVAPPFDVFTVEWNSPDRVWIHGSWEEQKPSQHGVVCTTIPVSDGLSVNSVLSQVKELVLGRNSNHPVLFQTDRTEKAISKSRWVMVLSYWTAFFAKPSFGRPYWTGCTSVVVVDGRGVPIDWFQLGPGFYYREDNIWKSDLSIINSPTHIALLTLSFMHCKNVELRDTQEFTDRKWLKRKKLRTVLHKTLVLKPLKKVLRTEGGMDKHGLRKALHICRGHFKTYGEDSPGMFGKLHGTFWVPQHVRGDAQNGTIVKDYRVQLDGDK